MGTMVPAGIRDDGKHKTFETGAKRDRALGKGRYDVLSPVAMRRIAQRSELGEIKYGDGRNWEKGMPISEFMDSALRHIFQYMTGEEQFIKKCMKRMGEKIDVALKRGIVNRYRLLLECERHPGILRTDDHKFRHRNIR
ncbi:hypothetical protein HPY28_09645 [Brevibacillus sp. HB1.2]|nr:hypothetical protein [Brevibacillus sp. HB1.2]